MIENVGLSVVGFYESLLKNNENFHIKVKDAVVLIKFTKKYFYLSLDEETRVNSDEDRKKYKNEIQKRRLIKNIKVKNVKSFMKKIYYKLGGI